MGLGGMVQGDRKVSLSGTGQQNDGRGSRMGKTELELEGLLLGLLNPHTDSHSPQSKLFLALLHSRAGARQGGKRDAGHPTQVSGGH